MAKKKAVRAGGEGDQGQSPAHRTGRRTRSESEQLWVIRQGQLLREARQKWERKTGEALASLVETAQVSRNVYYGYEGGRMCPSTVVLAKLAEAMSIPVESLFPDMKLLEE
jgi:DNA-binding XRE family transcriptional regulator